MRRNAFVMRKTVMGIHFPVRLPVEVWQAELRVAGRNHSISRWHLGDLLVHGEKADYGKTYDTAVSETGLGYQTIANLKSVARKVDISRRRENLSFGHHAEVAALPPEQQQRLLDLAVRNRWTRNSLREQVEKFSNGADTEPLPPAASNEAEPTTGAAPQQLRINIVKGPPIPIPRIQEVETRPDLDLVRDWTEKLRGHSTTREGKVRSDPEELTLAAAHRELRTFLMPWLERYAAVIGVAGARLREGLRLIEQMTSGGRRPKQRRTSKPHGVRCTELRGAAA